MTGIGDGIARLDGPEKVTGHARYAADFYLEGQAHAVLVGASVPSGRLKTVDTSRAEDVPGLLRVLSAGDFPVPAKGFGLLSVPPLATHHLPLQDEVIVYHGQPVAMIVAETLEAAEEAAGEVRVEIEPEPWVNPEGAPPEVPHPEGYAALGAVDVKVGDIDAAVRDSPLVVTGTYVQPSRHNNPMEPSAILAVWEDGRLTIYDSVQHLYAVQGALAAVFDIETTAVRVVSPYRWRLWCEGLRLASRDPRGDGRSHSRSADQARADPRADVLDRRLSAVDDAGGHAGRRGRRDSDGDPP